MSTAEKVKGIIVEQLGVDEDEVTKEASFTDDLGADSLDIVELVMAFEEEFGIEIPDEDAEKIATVKDAVDLHRQARQRQQLGPQPPSHPPELPTSCDRSPRRRVVVTGVGLVSPLGIGTAATWEGLMAGAKRRRSDHPFRRQRLSDAGSPARCTASTPPTTSRRRTSRRATSSSTSPSPPPRSRWRTRGLVIDAGNSERVGVVIGSGIGGLPLIEQMRTTCCGSAGRARVSPFFIPGLIVNMAAGQVSIRYGARGPNSRAVHRLHDRSARGRRRLPADPARRRRRDDRRRHRGGDHAARGGRLLRHAGAVDAQRRAGAGVAAVGRRPRRLRHGRRGGHPGARGARRARSAAARRSTPRSSATG